MLSERERLENILDSAAVRKLLESVRKLHGDERSQESKRQSYMEWLLRGEKAK